MRSEELVGRARQRIDAEAIEVDDAVRAGVDGIDVHQAAGVVDRPGDGGDVGPGADQVRRRGDGHESGPVRQHGLHVRQRQLGRRGIEVDPANGCPDPFGRLDPRPNVGVVVQPGDHDLVARSPRNGEGPGQVVGELGRGAPEHDSPRNGTDQVGHRGAGVGHDPIGVAFAVGPGPAVGQRLRQRGGDRIDDRPGSLRATGPVERRHSGFEGRELGSDRCDVVGHRVCTNAAPVCCGMRRGCVSHHGTEGCWAQSITKSARSGSRVHVQ